MVTLDDLSKLLVLLKSKTKTQAAEELGWTKHKVDYWVKRMHMDGIEVPTKSGARRLNIKELR